MRNAPSTGILEIIVRTNTSLTIGLFGILDRTVKVALIPLIALIGISGKTAPPKLWSYLPQRLSLQRDPAEVPVVAVAAKESMARSVRVVRSVLKTRVRPKKPVIAIATAN